MKGEKTKLKLDSICEIDGQIAFLINGYFKKCGFKSVYEIN